MDTVNYGFLKELEDKSREILKVKSRIIIAVSGRGGTGKSYLGKYIRKNGFGQFGKRSIAVIDDGVMWLEFLCFFKRRIKISCQGVDELKPFIDKMSRRKIIIFYMQGNPGLRISRADILVKLTTDENTRITRLKKRYNNNPQRIEKFLDDKDTMDFDIEYTSLIEAKV